MITFRALRRGRLRLAPFLLSLLERESDLLVPAALVSDSFLDLRFAVARPSFGRASSLGPTSIVLSRIRLLTVTFKDPYSF